MSAYVFVLFCYFSFVLIFVVVVVVVVVVVLFCLLFHFVWFFKEQQKLTYTPRACNTFREKLVEK